MKSFLSLVFFLTFSFSQSISNPQKVLNLDANVLSATLIDGLLYIATDDAKIQIYNLKDEKFEGEIKLKRVKNFFSDNEFPKIFSIDKIGQTLAVLTEADYAKRVLYLVKNSDIQEINLSNDALKKAFFIDENNLVLASLSDEIYFLNLKDRNIKNGFKFSSASLCDAEISKDRQNIAVATSGGKIYLYDIKNGKLNLSLDAHKDSIYDLAYKNGVLISGSTDKNVAIYNKNLQKFDTKFLVYAVSLSDDGEKAAFMSGELGDVLVVDSVNFSQIAKIKTGQRGLVDIIFYKDLLITTAYEKRLLFWRIK